MQKNSEIFFSLDLEMNQPSGSIIQVGGCIGNVTTGEILETFSHFINANEILNPRIIDLTGISQKQVDEGMSLEDSYKALVGLGNKYNPMVNPLVWGGGDSAELRKQLKLDEEKFLFGRRWFDVKTLSQSYLLSKGRPIQGGLAKSLLKYGLKFQGKKHNAMDDGINTFLLFREILKLFK